MVPGHPTRRPSLRRHLALAAAITFVVAMAAIDARATYGARISVDEPQYLLTAMSLAEDADLDISDELREQRYRPFHENTLNTQTVDLDDDGQRISPHDPLLPLLLAVPMALGGWAATKATLAALAALAAAATVWLTVRRLDVAPGPATVVVTALFSAPPLSSYGTQIYPEMPAALAVVVAVSALGSQRAPLRDLGVGIAVIALPWLSVKYVPVAGVLAVAHLWPLVRERPHPLGRRRRRAAAMAIVWLGAAAVYAVVHQRVYGGWTVYAAGDHFVDGEFLVVGEHANYRGRTRRLVGLLIDRRFGLVPWTPAYLLLAPAVVGLIRRRPQGWAVMTAAMAAAWATATWVALTMHGWWWPGRQLVVVLPLAVAAIAGLVADRPRLRLVATLGALAGTASWLWLALEASTDRRTIVVDFYETGAPWYRAMAWLLPDHSVMAGRDTVLTVVWTIVVIAVAVITPSGGRPEGPSTAPPPPRGDASTIARAARRTARS